MGKVHKLGDGGGVFSGMKTIPTFTRESLVRRRTRKPKRIKKTVLKLEKLSTLIDFEVTLVC
jgi:hypothetical protein